MENTMRRENALIKQIERLQKKLRDAEDRIEAMRSGRSDARFVAGPEENGIHNLKGADYIYRILVETMDEGAVILSEEERIIYCNRRFAEMIRVPWNRAKGNSVVEFIGPEDREKFRSIRNRVFENKCAKAEIAMKSGDGLIPSMVSLCILRADGLKFLYMVVRDLTDQKRAEETLKSYSKRLYRKNAELKKRAEQLARLSSELTMTEQRERKRMAQVLHDGLQQMLASAKLQVGCMVARLESDEQIKAAGNIEAILADSIKLARSLCLDLIPPVLHEGGLSAAMGWLAEWMREMHDLNVELFVESYADPDEDVKLLAFESVRELLFNVVKHADANWACVTLRRKGEEWLEIAVRDKGPGFDANRIEGKYGYGEGFGLFSIRERTALIGGKFIIESALGRSSCFTLLLPRKARSAFSFPIREDGFVSESARRADSVRRSATRVLLADDHALFRNGLAGILNLEPDIEVVGETQDGLETVEVARKLKPDVILMDINMPGLGGIEATSVIHREIPEIRIIGLSMYQDSKSARSMYKAGAQDYKSKDCAASDLLSAIRALGADSGWITGPKARLSKPSFESCPKLKTSTAHD